VFCSFLIFDFVLRSLKHTQIVSHLFVFVNTFFESFFNFFAFCHFAQKRHFFGRVFVDFAQTTDGSK